MRVVTLGKSQSLVICSSCKSVLEFAPWDLKTHASISKKDKKSYLYSIWCPVCHNTVVISNVVSDITPEMHAEAIEIQEDRDNS